MVRSNRQPFAVRTGLIDILALFAATREGIRQIVQIFRDHLATAFRFPPDVVKTLEHFID